MDNGNLNRAIDFLGTINGNKGNRTEDFTEFCRLLMADPGRVLRNVFQLFHDMLRFYVGEGVDEYPEDGESIQYVLYDCSKLFVEGLDYPFFADRLFANRLMKLGSTLKRSAQQNKIYLFKGPPGSGKSTFLNNLLQKFEEYTRTEEGEIQRTVWRLDPGLIAGRSRELLDVNSEYIEVPCPSYDNPVLMIPKKYRLDFFANILEGDEFLETLKTQKEYSWVWREDPCTICASLYQVILEKLKDPWKVFEMIYSRSCQFNRRLGEGLTVFMPGDKPMEENRFQNEELQKKINSCLGDSQRVKYLFSQYAMTNNGVYALMDLKSHNKTRFLELHNIISEGVHKVEALEERVHSLFLAVMNPEDHEGVTDFQSFEDRIEYIKIPYVMDLNTEVKIYRNIFGGRIDESFLPRVLYNFARVIISTRLNIESPAMQDWIQDRGQYKQYCDPNLHLLKMEIYTGHIPKWLSEEDRKGFTAETRRKIIAEGEIDGEKGISGRESIKLFNDFYSRFARRSRLINMSDLKRFFSELVVKEDWELIPEGFLDSLVDLYDFTVLQEVKECLFYYNEEQISKDIQNYLFGVNFEIGSVQKCHFTNDLLEINDEFFSGLENRLLNPRSSEQERLKFRDETQKRYSNLTLTREIIQEQKPITETTQFHELKERYLYRIKENVLDPFLKNENFRRGIKDFDQDEFKSYDKRIQAEVTFLMNNLMEKKGYTQAGAQEVCMYVVDKDLASKFATATT